MELTELLIGLMGYILADAAYFANDLSADELIAPFAIVQTDSKLDYKFYEADSQSEAIEKGIKELENLEQAEAWALARDGLIRNEDGTKTDVLVIEGWEKGMTSRLTILQPYVPATNGNGFAILGKPQFIIGSKEIEFKDNVILGFLTQGIERNKRSERLWK